MARRRLRTEKGWLYTQGAVEHTFALDEQTDIFPIIPFDDVEGDSGSAINKETSEWSVMRIILWAWGFWTPVNAPVNLKTRGYLFLRLGELQDDIDMTQFRVSPSFGVDRWSRVYQEEWAMCGRMQDFLFDGGSLIAAPSEGGNGVGNPGTIQQPTVKWDISTRTRIHSGSSICLEVGQSEDLFAEAGEQCGWHYAMKVLLSRKQ